MSSMTKILFFKLIFKKFNFYLKIKNLRNETTTQPVVNQQINTLKINICQAKNGFGILYNSDSRAIIVKFYNFLFSRASAVMF